ncbi:hypothetical protein Xen7305DRAFT_00011030 [Xenococcus sp. PCC 7305]|nr:hypothetical protein Xen7305DRAFT_00011030 [Xenococcus sp. PCC 7305]
MNKASELSIYKFTLGKNVTINTVAKVGALFLH